MFQATLPVDDLPTTDRIRTVFDHLWIPPGTTTGGSSNCCSGPMIEYVISGSYTVRAAAAIEVIRADWRRRAHACQLGGYAGAG